MSQEALITEVARNTTDLFKTVRLHTLALELTEDQLTSAFECAHVEYMKRIESTIGIARAQEMINNLANIDEVDEETAQHLRLIGEAIGVPGS